MTRCIWCGQDKQKLSREHIIPESLGGNDLVVLEGAVCAQCNNGFGRLDNALVKQFEIVRQMYGVPGKRGRRPTITSWAPISSGYDVDGQPVITLNAGPGDIHADGKKLVPAHPSNGIENPSIEFRSGGVSRIRFKQRFGDDPLFTRALYKIALCLVARSFGADVASGPAYDHIRQYVCGLPGARPRRYSMDQTHQDETSGFSDAYGLPVSSYPYYELTILGTTFLLDLDPDEANLRQLQGVGAARGRFLWVSPPQ